MSDTNAPAESGAAGTSTGRAARSADRFLPVACGLALFGLAVTVVHFVAPSPLMFTLFMTLGQGSFALAIAIYAFVILAELRRKKVL